MKKIKYFIILFLILLLMIFVVRYHDEILELSAIGYFGIFISCFLANSTIFLPAPSSAIVFTMSSVYSPFWVAIIGGIGATVGEQAGYIAGLSGKHAFTNDEPKQDDKYEMIKTNIEKFGIWAILLFAFLPLPLFDLVGVASGVLKINFVKFNLGCLTGKILKMFIYAYIGAGFVPIIIEYLEKIKLF